jgi:hypothetical protein
VGKTVKTPLGRELAWQSTQEVGCGRLAAVRGAWKSAGVVPPRLVAQVAGMLIDGATWQTTQSWGTALAAVGRPLLQRTASCFISPEAGVLAGLVAAGPTKPIGFELAWQSAHADGCGRLRFARDEWRLPG